MIEYRKATIDDIETLLQIRIDFMRDVKSVTTDDDEKVMREANAEYLNETLPDGSFIQWLAADNGKIIATGSVSFYKLPPNRWRPNGKVAYIANMFTYPEYRKQGIATKLLSLSVEDAKSRGCKQVLLDATAMGKPLYEKFGFTDAKDYMVYRI